MLTRHLQTLLNLEVLPTLKGEGSLGTFGGVRVWFGSK